LKKIGLLLCVVLMISACTTKFTKNEYGLGVVKETEHAIFYAQANDDETKETIQQLSTYFEQHYERITNMFNYSTKQKTIIHLYTDKQHFHRMIGRQTEGTYDATDQIIKVYTPSNMNSEEQIEEYNFQLVHEFVHAVIQQNNPIVGQIKWLDEGTAYYASLQLELEKEKKKEVDISKAPTLEQLADPHYFSQYGSLAYY